LEEKKQNVKRKEAKKKLSTWWRGQLVQCRGEFCREYTGCHSQETVITMVTITIMHWALKDLV
jgi:hypothetical protein